MEPKLLFFTFTTINEVSTYSELENLDGWASTMCCHQRKMCVLVEAGQMFITLVMKLDFQGEEWTHH